MTKFHRPSLLILFIAIYLILEYGVYCILYPALNVFSQLASQNSNNAESIEQDTTDTVETYYAESESTNTMQEDQKLEESDENDTENESSDNEMEEFTEDHTTSDDGNDDEPTSNSEPMDDDRIYDTVDQIAQFPGGDEACFRWLRDHIEYPSICQEQGIQGRVIVSLVINQDGSIVDVKTLRSPDNNLSKEAERVVKQMPRWKPARLGNKPVRSRFNLPIMFRLG